MKYDAITIVLGEFGKYQKIVYFLVCLPVISIGIQVLLSVFSLASPSYRCSLPGSSNDSFAVRDIHHAIRINQSIPIKYKDGTSFIYESCKVYSTNENTTYNEFNVPINASVGSCDSWVYDQSTFQKTVITEFDLVCGQELARANANMATMAGLLIGAFSVGGVVSDVFGRKMGIMISSLFHVVGAFGSSFPTTYIVFVIFRFLMGISTTGLFGSLFVLGMELVGPSYRVAAGITVELFWCTGLFVLCFVAFFVRSWNYLQLAVACPTVLLFLCYWLPESPRWLISKGRYKEARVVLQKCAKVNGVTLPDDIIGNDTMEHRRSQSVLKIFTAPKLLVRTLIIYLNWIVVNMVYYGLSLNVGNLSGDIYLNFAINSLCELGAYVMCLLLLNRVGRKWLHCGSMILGGAACLSTIFTVLYANENQHWITVMLPNIGKFGISAAFAIIWFWTAELFPTVVRSSGVGSSNMMGRLGSMLCPYIVEIGTFIKGDFGKSLPLIIFGSMAFIAGLLSLLLPETRGTVLPETIEDAENFGRHNKPAVTEVVLQVVETGL
ncbi:organic cation transporter protein-like [Dreissena polymorpha]|uniref:Major facilitator superfamily (MFS) profile domain-containing protein n=1 Tax=Dreissena polymorpha TaxID=45954 RepID=A0A9D4JT46_DREPO|nr:organic cation transporter protein-like [Dreissena polymorpha]XP_052285678.1 organic cation transporter protein-like [Dreissena polymorpha]XP_052285679.1 organic cation transporter protein-like [Dreissena polymorpha]KAH3819708.1 hypothetical protein DPMN_121451 [Dreissena polymorpha]